MIRSVPFFVLCFILVYQVYSQEAPSQDYKGTLFYLEAGGAGGYYSVNAERVFASVGKFKLSGRVGFGNANFDLDNYNNDPRKYYTIPVGVQAFRGSGYRHIEFGLGLSYIEGEDALVTYETIENETLYLVPSIGYRYQKPSGGFFVRVLYTPHIRIKEFSGFTGFDEKFDQWLGISIGHCFTKTKKQSTADSNNPEKKYKLPVLYVEAGGASGEGATVNVEYSFLKIKNWNMGVRAGYGGYPVKTYQYRGIPIGLTVFNGTGSHHFEAGMAVSYIEGNEYVRFNEPGLGFDKTYWTKFLYLVPSIGYRFQSPDSRLFFRMTFTQFFEIKKYVDDQTYEGGTAKPFPLGIAVGYRF